MTNKHSRIHTVVENTLPYAKLAGKMGVGKSTVTNLCCLIEEEKPVEVVHTGTDVKLASQTNYRNNVQLENVILSDNRGHTDAHNEIDMIKFYTTLEPNRRNILLFVLNGQDYCDSNPTIRKTENAVLYGKIAPSYEAKAIIVTHMDLVSVSKDLVRDIVQNTFADMRMFFFGYSSTRTKPSDGIEFNREEYNKLNEWIENLRTPIMVPSEIKEVYVYQSTDPSDKLRRKEDEREITITKEFSEKYADSVKQGYSQLKLTYDQLVKLVFKGKEYKTQVPWLWGKTIHYYLRVEYHTSKTSSLLLQDYELVPDAFELTFPPHGS